MTEPPSRTSEPQPALVPVEPRGERLRRRARRVRLYLWSFVAIAMLIVIVALIVANTRHVHVSWVFGSGNVSLVWLILVSAIVGWLLGIATSILFRRRTRRRT